jgi:hypothetical protein
MMPTYASIAARKDIPLIYCPVTPDSLFVDIENFQLFKFLRLRLF